MKRLERSGHRLPDEALKAPVIISNKIGRGITEAEAERAKAETMAKLLHWKVRRGRARALSLSDWSFSHRHDV